MGQMAGQGRQLSLRVEAQDRAWGDGAVVLVQLQPTALRCRGGSGARGGVSGLLKMQCSSTCFLLHAPLEQLGCTLSAVATVVRQMVSRWFLLPKSLRSS